MERFLGVASNSLTTSCSNTGTEHSLPEAKSVGRVGERRRGGELKRRGEERRREGWGSRGPVSAPSRRGRWRRPPPPAAAPVSAPSSAQLPPSGPRGITPGRDRSDSNSGAFGGRLVLKPFLKAPFDRHSFRPLPPPPAIRRTPGHPLAALPCHLHPQSFVPAAPGPKRCERRAPNCFPSEPISYIAQGRDTTYLGVRSSTGQPGLTPATCPNSSLCSGTPTSHARKRRPSR